MRASVHIDELSCKFAKKIETLMTKTEADRFNLEMVRKYCMLVKLFSAGIFTAGTEGGQPY